MLISVGSLNNLHAWRDRLSYFWCRVTVHGWYRRSTLLGSGHGWSVSSCDRSEIMKLWWWPLMQWFDTKPVYKRNYSPLTATITCTCSLWNMLQLQLLFIVATFSRYLYITDNFLVPKVQGKCVMTTHQMTTHGSKFTTKGNRWANVCWRSRTLGGEQEPSVWMNCGISGGIVVGFVPAGFPLYCCTRTYPEWRTSLG